VSGRIDLTFVAIGYNEAGSIAECIASLRQAAPEGVSIEILYVDGGSQDASIEVATSAGADRILGGDKRRRAAENRNLGLQAARGEFVQFVDGDMTLDPEWARVAVEFLRTHPEVGALCGNIDETRTGLIARVLELDWRRCEGKVTHVGGAAMFRRDVIEKVGGFPEDMPYGEEPWLCWRIRNELGLGVHQLDRRMVNHDLAFRGFRDYWRRGVRCGETYVEVASRCWHTADKFWLRETLRNIIWSGVILVALLLLIFAPTPIRLAVLLLILAVIARKGYQFWRRGRPFGIAMLYGFHAYFIKLPIAWGEVKRLARL
jgi:glycosyltransferase involved in cell wall biosynthesis